MKKILLIICLAHFFNCLGQEDEGFRDGDNRFTGTDRLTSIRIGGLLQKGYYGELGISKQEVTCGCAMCSYLGYYSSIEWIPKEQKNIPGQKVGGNDIYGLKVGYELNALISLGIELKYLSDFYFDKDFMITPKIGLGYLGIVNVYYGYNISTNNYPFPEIGKHQLSIVFNIPIVSN